MRVWLCRETPGSPKGETALREQGRHLSLKGGKAMVRLNLSFNLAVQFPLHWLAALLYLIRVR